MKTINGDVKKNFDSKNAAILYAKNELGLETFNLFYDKNNKWEITISGEYVYRISSTFASSSKYGNCEVCGNHVAEVYSQVEAKEYTFDGKEGYTYHNCHNIFGHKECIQNKMKVGALNE